MRRYAVLNENDQIINIILAKSLDVAEEMTSSICIEVAPTNNDISIGYQYKDGIFFRIENLEGDE